MGRKRKRKESARLNLGPLWAGLLVFLASGLFVFLVLNFLPGFKVNENSVLSNVRVSKSLLRKVVGKPLYMADINKVREAILAYDNAYQDVVVVKRFPNIIEINVVSRKPFAQWKSDRSFLLSREGVVLSDPKITDFKEYIPIVIGDYKEEVSRGSVISDRRLEVAFKLIETLKENHLIGKFNVTEIDATNLSNLSFFIDKTQIKIGDRAWKRKLDDLDNVVRQKAYDLSLIKYIDLRYKKVYIGHRR
ncbi:MAG: cell division protein FtsQ/DivIB [Candidatus Omnitrophica bacterium]|jgi:cell division septal protein FtsQ|nr:cell division protein FtsQ/DivIB [Candidatus Omnitrophota bacterium]MDD5080441.1 cell division protein FtsQ/DivIB [Candidatus Omnitrophota bacterium]MDD5441395.1 cell division protein FtsQ/DivIB [Candidatus Omnitrophota bacterium]